MKHREIYFPFRERNGSQSLAEMTFPYFRKEKKLAKKKSCRDFSSPFSPGLFHACVPLVESAERETRGRKVQRGRSRLSLLTRKEFFKKGKKEFIFRR